MKTINQINQPNHINQPNQSTQSIDQSINQEVQGEKGFGIQFKNWKNILNRHCTFSYFLEQASWYASRTCPGRWVIDREGKANWKTCQNGHTSPSNSQQLQWLGELTFQKLTKMSGSPQHISQKINMTINHHQYQLPKHQFTMILSSQVITINAPSKSNQQYQTISWLNTFSHY